GILVDCHSMPASVRVPDNGAGADFIIGDRFGTSASPALSDHAIALLKGMGYRVAYNKPYAGGFITEHYGRPVNGLHALQIEVNRALYMDEARLEKSPNFAPLARDIEAFVSRLLADTANEHTHAFAASTPLAAE
ncbi:MAG: N-formylglutamate amidohydrolase, partial [Nitratireductor sp.]|nr:N-formylglutamate amidohydrolase [Nitratireductor sp.]